MPRGSRWFPNALFIMALVIVIAVVSVLSFASGDSASLDQLIADAEAKLSEIESVELLVTLEQYNATDGSVTPGKGRLTARIPDVFRFDWLQPDMMAGSILLVDKQSNEARQYNPIREEIIVQRWDDLAARQNLGPEIDRWLSVPSPDDFLLELGNLETIDDKTASVILARPRETPEILYEFVIDTDTGLVSHFRQYDRSGRVILRGALTEVYINGDVSTSRLTEMPPFARIRHR